MLTPASATSAPVSQAVMQGVSLHITQGLVVEAIIGVPAAARSRGGARTMQPGGQAVMQSLQRVHFARN